MFRKVKTQFSLRSPASVGADTAPAPDLARRVLLARGCSGPEAEAWLEPPAPELADPFTLKGMREAVACLLPLVQTGKPILIHGDYDTDGVTAAALLQLFFTSLKLPVEVCIPNRLTDGYGLSAAGVSLAVRQGVSAVVTCDCGSSSPEACEQLQAAGIAVVITDHHTCPPVLPTAAALVNPHQPGETATFTAYSGAGVALKLCQALSLALDQPDSYKAFMDLAAIGTVGDVMPLRGENRQIVRLGLALLRQNPRPGLAQLLQLIRVPAEKVDAWTIGHQLSPRINAAGRLGDSQTACQLLTTADEQEAASLARHLEEQNHQRQELVTQAGAEARQQLALQPDQISHACLVLAHDTWPVGILGIVASRLSEDYACPCVVLGPEPAEEPEEGGTVAAAGGRKLLRGSARSYGKIDLLALLESARDLTVHLGGHPQAAGLTLEQDRLPDFRARLAAAADQLPLTQFAAGDRQLADCMLWPSDLTLEQANRLDALGPFGQDNPEPLFLLQAVTLRQPRLMGSRQEHLKAVPEWSGQLWPQTAVLFFGLQPADMPLQQDGCRVDILAALKINEFRGQKELQLLVSAYRLLSDAASVAAAAASDQPATPRPLPLDGPETDRLALISQLLTLTPAWGAAEIGAVLGLDYAELLPDKQLLADSWRCLQQLLQNGPRRLSLDELSDSLTRLYNSKHNAYQLACCLKIFAQAGLLALRRLPAEELVLAIKPVRTKVDLYATQIYQDLRGKKTPDKPSGG
ncbi:MAG: single-stranded-DNA-specific exonuclease RecJ [Oscillospiraceae bacterium]|nr:single-stranded-DNA-specific exonuclease RecJ [Oscillospiraceae bacterium]MDD4367724.1 single-stranded-DNA-specific exonuclease RecJ [Oscillospiraceae bacterium]